METHLYITSNGHNRCYPSPNITLMKKLSPTLQKRWNHIKTFVVTPPLIRQSLSASLHPEIWGKDSLREKMCILKNNWWTFQKWINLCDVLLFHLCQIINRLPHKSMFYVLNILVVKIWKLCTGNILVTKHAFDHLSNLVVCVMCSPILVYWMNNLKIDRYSENFLAESLLLHHR